ncbi:Na+/H+ antiporter subunit E [Rheinheimera texasensis]|uniref:Na+/H+ antiporter subunit E n=1 Tax=Rheinheimera texasensis TaxID=306205 RepID=UPI0004E22677|nr:Na+/H+ antiporter subunit E [Rheinheimera texasensis]
MQNSLFATPLRSTLLFLVWCALHNSVSPVVLLSGVILALLIPWVSRGFREVQPQVKRYGLFGRYLLMVLWDIVVANLQVVKVVLGRNSALKPGFVLLPLDLKEPLPLTILAATICLTPGTVSAELLPREADAPQFLLLHVLDLQDEAALIRELKQRYEAPLQEIFACSV